MISPLLKITTLALICSLSLAGITVDVISPSYENTEISSRYICDHTKPTEFPPAFKTNFNCTSFVTLANGNYACNDNPCQVLMTYGAYMDCVWQISTSKTLAFLVSGTTSYVLRPCYKCDWPTCSGRTYKDYQVCKSGKMVTNDYGVTWTCQDDTCKGQMKLQADKTYACVSSSCASVMMYESGQWVCPGQSNSTPTPVNTDSSSSGSSLLPWIIALLLSFAVIYQAIQKRNQALPNQFTPNQPSQYTGANTYY